MASHEKLCCYMHSSGDPAAKQSAWKSSSPEYTYKFCAVWQDSCLKQCKGKKRITVNCLRLTRTHAYIPSLQKALKSQETGLCKGTDCIHPGTRGQHQTKASGVAAPFWDPPIWLRRVLDEETDRNPFRTLALSRASSSLYPRRSCSAGQQPDEALPQSTRFSSST